MVDLRFFFASEGHQIGAIRLVVVNIIAFFHEFFSKAQSCDFQAAKLV